MQQSLISSAALQIMFTQVNHHRHPQAMNMVSDIIKPETSLEKSIIQENDWMEGAFWGEPRSGHPEGKVIFHIREVLDNVDRITSNQVLRQQLRLITIIHDNFKHLEETHRPRRDWNRHHAVYAMKFAQKFIEQQHILDIIELHDEAYYAWQQSKKMELYSAEQRLNVLFNKLGEDYKQLYYLFFKCDTFTGDKIPTPISWFENTVKDIKIAAL